MSDHPVPKQVNNTFSMLINESNGVSGFEVEVLGTAKFNLERIFRQPPAVKDFSYPDYRRIMRS